MEAVLVTGGAGFIGTNFCFYWTRRYPESKLIVLDALTYAADRQNLAELESNGKLQFVQGDICNTQLVEELLRHHRVSTVVHFAAESHVDRSISGPDEFLRTNVTGTHSLLKAAKNVWLDAGLFPDQHRFHHVSTDEVYGSLTLDEAPFAETTPYAPNSPYSASKAASDHFVRAYHHTYGLKTSQSNCSNNYGPFQHSEKLIPVVIARLLAGESVPVYGDGKNIRDWLYVEDHCRAIDLILSHGQAGEVYNIGGENEWENLAIVGCIAGLIDQKFSQDAALAAKFPRAMVHKGLKSEELIAFVTDRPGHDRRYAINSNKSRLELGFQPSVDFVSGINKTLDWYLARAVAAA